MKKVQVNEVREKLAKYLSEAEQGEEIIITKHSRPIARLVSYEEKKPRLPDLTEFRKGIEIEGSVLETLLTMRKEDRY